MYQHFSDFVFEEFYYVDYGDNPNHFEDRVNLRLKNLKIIGVKLNGTSRSLKYANDLNIDISAAESFFKLTYSNTSDPSNSRYMTVTKNNKRDFGILPLPRPYIIAPSGERIEPVFQVVSGDDNTSHGSYYYVITDGDKLTTILLLPYLSTNKKGKIKVIEKAKRHLIKKRGYSEAEVNERTVLYESDFDLTIDFSSSNSIDDQRISEINKLTLDRSKYLNDLKRDSDLNYRKGFDEYAKNQFLHRQNVSGTIEASRQYSANKIKAIVTVSGGVYTDHEISRYELNGTTLVFFTKDKGMYRARPDRSFTFIDSDGNTVNTRIETSRYDHSTPFIYTSNQFKIIDRN